MRFMTLVRGSEHDGPPPMELINAIGELGIEATQAGVLVETGGLQPTTEGARIRITGDKIAVTDGPFTEAKEVIGGYAVYELPSKEEAIKWSVRFMELHTLHWPGWEGEVELREVMLVPGVGTNG